MGCLSSPRANLLLLIALISLPDRRHCWRITTARARERVPLRRRRSLAVDLSPSSGEEVQGPVICRGRHGGGGPAPSGRTASGARCGRAETPASWLSTTRTAPRSVSRLGGPRTCGTSHTHLRPFRRLPRPPRRPRTKRAAAHTQCQVSSPMPCRASLND
jgi:hypothetical protein